MRALKAILRDEVKLYRRADGCWMASYYDVDGMRHFMRLGSDEGVAAKKAARLQAAFTANPALRDPDAPTKVTAPTLADWWDDWSSRAEISTRTLAAYRHQWAALVRHFGQNARLDRLDPDECAKWARSLQTGRELISARAIVARCKSMLRAAVDRGIIKTNPFALIKTGLPIVDREWTYTSRPDAAKLIASGDPAAVSLWLALCRYGGLRPGEARRITWGDYDPAARRLTVRPARRVRDTKNRLRLVPVCPELAALLAGQHPAPLRIVTGGKLTLLKGIAAAFEASGVKPDPRTPLHSMRRSRTTDLLADGLDVATVARIQGDSPIVVMRYYHIVTPAAEASITGLVAPVLRPTVTTKRRKAGSVQ